MRCKLCGRDDGSHEPTCTVSVAPRPWRVGRSVGRTIYNALNELIGVMDSPAIAALVVEAVNGYEKKIRRAFIMTDEEHLEMRQAHTNFQPLAGRLGPRPNDRPLKAWEALGTKYGFDEMTVEMDQSNDHAFTAVIR